MLRELLRHSRQPGVPGTGTGDFLMVSAAAEAEGGAGGFFSAAAVPAVAALSSAEQASSLITSCARKQAEKRRADAAQGGTHAQPKRSRAEDAATQVPDQDHQLQLHDDGSTSDVSIDDQENLQQAMQYQQLPAATQHTVVRAACSTLGHMLAPFVGWMPGTHGQHAQLHELQNQHLLSLQQQQQQVGAEAQPAAEDAAELQPACARREDAAWSDETVVCSEEGLNNSPTSSSGVGVPATSQQPSTAGTAGHSLQSHPHAAAAADQATLQPQQATCSVEGGTAVTSAGNTAEDSDDVEYDDEDDFCPYTFISSLGPVERYVAPGRQPLLPRQTRACKQKTLVLDLDETLVHSTLEPGYGAGADFSFPVLFNGSEHMVHVRIRPHMQTFLERVAELFEVVVFTASQKVYAEKLLNILDPTRTLIRHRIYRDSCVVVDGNYLKDLSVLGRDLARCAIVDNSPQAFGFQLSNGIPIESWYDDASDSELLALLPFLETLVDVDDVRPHIRSKFQLDQRVTEANQRLAAAAATAMAAVAVHQEVVPVAMQFYQAHAQEQAA